MSEKVIASLTGKVRYDVDFKAINAFEKKLDAIAQKMKATTALAQKKLEMRLGLNTADVQKGIKLAEKTKVRLHNVSIAKETLANIQTLLKARLEKTTIRLSRVVVSGSALQEQKLKVQQVFGKIKVEADVGINAAGARRALYVWKREIESKFNLKFKAGLAEAASLKSFRESLKRIEAKIGNLRIATPKIQVTINKTMLKDEVRKTLEAIRRDVKLDVTVNGNLRRSGGGSNGGGYQGSGRHMVGTAGLTGAAMHWGRGFVPGLGGAFAIASLNRTNQELQAQGLAMSAVMGGDNAGKEQVKWIRQLSDDIGLSFKDVTPAYTRMLASGQSAGMEVGEVQSIFQGVSEYGRVMGLSTEDMKGSLRAIEQMMNKNQIMSEELKGQLAERMPGVISAMAEAAGFGTGDDAASKLFKAMEKGEVRSDNLTKFAEILQQRAAPKLEDAKKSTSAQQQRFMNAYNLSVVEFGKGGFDPAMGTFFQNAAEALEDATPLVRALGGAFQILIEPVNAVVSLLGTLGALLPNIASRVGIAEKNLLAFGAAFTVLKMSPIGRVVTLIAGLALALEDLVGFMQGKDSAFGDWFKTLDPETQETILRFFTAVQNAGNSLLDLIGMVKEGWKELFNLFGEWADDSSFGTTILRFFTDVLNSITQIVYALKLLKEGKFQEAWQALNNNPRGVSNGPTQPATAGGPVGLLNSVTRFGARVVDAPFYAAFGARPVNGLLDGANQLAGATQSGLLGIHRALTPSPIDQKLQAINDRVQMTHVAEKARVEQLIKAGKVNEDVLAAQALMNNTNIYVEVKNTNASPEEIAKAVEAKLGQVVEQAATGLGAKRE